MFESKYSKYIAYNPTRFAEEDEILSQLVPADKCAGVPLYAKDGIVYVDDKDNHSIVIGGTGCGKSRACSKTTIRSVIAAGESAIVNDPKGELFKTTAGFAKHNNYRIYVLNLRDPEKSHHWNPLYSIYLYYHSGQLSKAQQAIDDFATDMMIKTANERDRYWDTVAAAYLSRIIELCMYFAPTPAHFTLENIIPLCNESSERTIISMMDYVDNLSEAVKAGINGVVTLQAEKTKSCIYSVLNSGLNTLIKSSALLTLFNSSDIDFRQMAFEPTITYIIYPDEKSTMNNVVKAFLTQAYTALVDVCNEQANDRLPVRMNFILDEFSNLTQIESFDNRISESRSKNIRYHLYCQSMNQLSEKYGDYVAETILSNCTSWVCFSSKETKFLEYISRLCGTVTDYNGAEKPLISPSELQFLEKGDSAVEVLILRQGVRPYVTRLPYYDKIYEANYTLPEIIPSKISVTSKLRCDDWIRLAQDYESKNTCSMPELLTDEEQLESLTAALQKSIDFHYGPVDSADDEDD
ncbi:MAG: type IV secretory system conjugative DNA transfer family protein [Ruminococcus sp.]|nr:type IV secretory system conjugative DNA transfer family protein [Ruminococcus sp.]